MKMKSIFEVGDNVQFVERSYGETGMKGRFASVGDTGTIVEVDDHDSHIPYNVDIGDGSVWATPSNIELIVESVRKFAVGDKVRVTDTHYYGAGGPDNGDVGVVTGYVTSTYPPITDYAVVRFDSNVQPKNSIGDDGWRFADDDIELIEAVESTTPATITVEGVTRTVGAETDNVRFLLRYDDIIDVHVAIDVDEHISVTMTLAQFNEVYRILNEEGNA